MPITGPDILLYEKKDRIVTITINRPERLNAISFELMERLSEAWVRFRDEEDAWVCILTAVGDRAFSAGADLKDEAERTAQGIARPKVPQFYGVECWKPKIAAVNGIALAGGFLLSMDCDIRLAAEHAEFGITEARWNMMARWVVPLTRYFTLGHALEVALWGDERITAQRAYEMGFVNRVVSKEQLMEEAMSWAERMLCLGPRAVRYFKECIYRGHTMTFEEGMAFANALQQNLAGMEDGVEGPKAFAEKRKPVFKNR
ncbi:enoyl-CoA hydratase/isomerase family protein [Chloroflexota bacterium]